MMKRLSFLAVLFGIGSMKAQKAERHTLKVPSALPGSPPTKKYFITGPFCSKAIEVRATGVLDAIARAGFTVWDEERWKETLRIPAVQKMEEERVAYPECGRVHKWAR